MQKVKNILISAKLKKPEIGIVIEQDMLEKRAKIAFLSIGSNLGNKKKNIEIAKFKLKKKKWFFGVKENPRKTL